MVWDGEKPSSWRSLKESIAPRRVQVQRDPIGVDKAIKLVSEGTGLMWRGDYVNANLLLQVLKRRTDPHGRKPKVVKENRARKGKNEYGINIDKVKNMRDLFHQLRVRKATRTRKLDMILVPFDENHKIPLSRAPDVSTACHEVFGKVDAPSDVLGPGGKCGRPIRPPALRWTLHGRQTPLGPADTIL